MACKDALVTSMLGRELLSPQSPHPGENMRGKLRTPLAALALLAVIAVIAAGCSNASGGTGSSGTNTTTADASHAQAVKFAECMRQNGVSGFPDPDTSGTFTIDAIANGSGVNVSSPGFTRAMSACKDLEPPGFTGQKRTPQQQQAALQFAQCIRDNGVKDFPDPAPDGPMIDTSRIPSVASSGLGILQAAMQKCSGLAAAAGVTGGK